MLASIRAAAKFIREKQILKKLGVVISLSIIGIACYVLFHMLRGIDVENVINAITQTKVSSIALAEPLFRRGACMAMRTTS